MKGQGFSIRTERNIWIHFPGINSHWILLYSQRHLYGSFMVVACSHSWLPGPELQNDIELL